MSVLLTFFFYIIIIDNMANLLNDFYDVVDLIIVQMHKGLFSDLQDVSGVKYSPRFIVLYS